MLNIGKEHGVVIWDINILQNYLLFNNYLTIIIPEDLKSNNYSLERINHWKEFIKEKMDRITGYSKILDYFISIKERVIDIRITKASDIKKKIGGDNKIKEIIKLIEEDYKKLKDIF